MLFFWGGGQTRAEKENQDENSDLGNELLEEGRTRKPISKNEEKRVKEKRDVETDSGREEASLLCRFGGTNIRKGLHGKLYLKASGKGGNWVVALNENATSLSGENFKAGVITRRPSHGP